MTGALALGAGPAAAQYEPPEQDGCTKQTLHPEYQGQGLCEEPAPAPEPAPEPAPQPEYTPPEQPEQDQCTEEGLHPEYQGQGLCNDSPDPQPEAGARAAADPPGLIGLF